MFINWQCSKIIIADNMNPMHPGYRMKHYIQYPNTKAKLMISEVIDIVTENEVQVNEVNSNTLR